MLFNFKLRAPRRTRFVCNTHNLSGFDARTGTLRQLSSRGKFVVRPSGGSSYLQFPHTNFRLEAELRTLVFARLRKEPSYTGLLTLTPSWLRQQPAKMLLDLNNTIFVLPPHLIE